MVYALLFIAGGAGALWVARLVSTTNRETRGWAVTNGRIVERGLKMVAGRGGPTYAPELKYMYTVGGREYTGTQVYAVGEESAMKTSAQRLVDGLPDPIPVHYDPRDPQRAYVLANSRGAFWWPLVAGIIFLVVGLMLLVVALLGTDPPK